MDTVVQPTWVQRHISPWATRVCAAKWQDRRKVAALICSLATHFKETDKNGAYFELDLALRRTGYLYEPHAWLRSKFRPSILLESAGGVELEDIQPYHVRKTITLEELLGVIKRVFDESGLVSEEEGSGLYKRIVLDVVEGKAGETQLMVPAEISYRHRAVRPQVLRSVQFYEPQDKQWPEEIIGQAVDFAMEVCGVKKEDAEYVVRKMGRIGGDVYSVIAALVRQVPVLDLRAKFEANAGEAKYARLIQLRDPICAIVGVFQFMRDNFTFGMAELDTNKEYLFQKMGELARLAQAPQNLLVFFLHALIEGKGKKEEGEEREIPNVDMLDRIRFLYAPLAERLGLIFLADDFRDQYLKWGRPQEYQEIEAAILKRIGFRSYETAKFFLDMYTRELFRFLESNGVDTRGIDIKFRVKSPFSVWNKLFWRKKYSLERIHDILGIKITCPADQEHKVLLSIARLLEGKNSPFVSIAKRKKVALGKVALRQLKKEAFAEGFEGERAEELWKNLMAAGHINEKGELLKELGEDARDFVLEAPGFTAEEREIAFDILKKAQEIVWRGIKLEGHDRFGKPLEIQIMDEEMNKENTHGKVATWFYNLLKELRDRPDFPKREIREVVSSDYVANFISFLHFWSAKPPGGVRPT